MLQRHTRCGRHCLREDRRTKVIKCRYKNRPPHLENLYLFDYAALYRFAGIQYVPRRQRAIVRIFPRLKVGSTASESEKY